MKTKNNYPVIYKQDIMDKDGKLNTFGALLVVGVFMACFNLGLEIFSDSIIDKNNIN